MSEEQGTQRELSQAEIRRAELLKEREEKLFAEGYERHDLTTTIEAANSTALLLPLPFAAAILILFFALHGIKGIIDILQNHLELWIAGMIVFMISSVVLAFVHECIHAAFWAMGTENGLKDIELGFIKEKVTPYCTSKAPLSKGMYILGSLMPATILGLGFGIAGVITGNFLVMVIGVVQTFAGAGDFLVSSMLFKYKTARKDTVIMDHPTEVGLIVYEKD